MLRLLLSGSILAALTACGSASGSGDTGDRALLEEKEGPKLRRFASAREFERFVRSVQERAAVAQKTLAFDAAPGIVPAEPVMNEATAVDAATTNPEITNNQTIGVDEGGIVKQVGRHLVVLQDGRLFSIDLGREAGAPLRLSDRADVYRSREKAAEWYDEMLVRGDRILVAAYSYSERATEITVFRIDSAGRLTREGRFLLSSDDYYSTDNYATRLVGDNLVFYAPYAIDGYGSASFQWPRLRRADGDGEAGRGEDLLGPTDIYAPAGEVDWPVIHAVSICPLADALDCRTTAFVGPWSREFFVSPTDAFLWLGAPDGLPWSVDYANLRRRGCPEGQAAGGLDQSALVYRLPLDGGLVGAVAVDGVPTDQFAFDSREGRFRALLGRSEAGCRAYDSSQQLALLDLPLSAFGTRLRRAADRAYTPLPAIEGGQLENRFLGDWLVYGGRTDWSSEPAEGRQPTRSALFAVPLAQPGQPVKLDLPHNALRIERAGSDAVVTGYRDRSGLSLSYVALGAQPHLAATTTLPRRFESENRSHAFNAWMRGDGSGLIGLPTTERIWRSDRGWSDSENSELSFIAIGPDKKLAAAGELGLEARKPAQGYSCEVSCVDWYGNSRPIFTGGRIFALMGTELVEGRLADGQIAELARVDLTAAPTGLRAGR